MKTLSEPCWCGEPIDQEGRYECAEHAALSDANAVAQAAEALAKRQSKALEQVTKMTPLRFAGTDVKSPDFNASLWRSAKNWKPSKEVPWLGLVGATGTCKTRCAFLRFQELALETAAVLWSDLKLQFITGPEFGVMVREQWGKNSRSGFGSPSRAPTARQSLSELIKADVLLFDELGKVASSPAVVSELFALIDHRHSRCLPTIWTSNTDPQQFCANMGDEYAGPIAGRIIETSTIFSAT